MFMERILLFLIAIGVVFVMGCQKTQKQVGFVEFSVEGKRYHMENRRFMIRANPVLGEGDKIKVIPKGMKTLFEFSIGPTSARQKEESEALGRILEKEAKGEIADEDIYTFDAVWVAETAEPEEILKSKVTLEDQTLGLKNFAIIINVPGLSITNPAREIHNCWIKIDEITSDRVKGRFGGRLTMTLTGKELDKKLKQGLINEVEKEIDISDGVFDVPYKKCFEYR